MVRILLVSNLQKLWLDISHGLFLHGAGCQADLPRRGPRCRMCLLQFYAHKNNINTWVYVFHDQVLFKTRLARMRSFCNTMVGFLRRSKRIRLYIVVLYVMMLLLHQLCIYLYTYACLHIGIYRDKMTILYVCQIVHLFWNGFQIRFCALSISNQNIEQTMQFSGAAYIFMQKAHSRWFWRLQSQPSVFWCGFQCGLHFSVPSFKFEQRYRISFLFEIKAKFCHNQNPAQIMSDLWCAQTTLNVKMSDLWQVHLMQPFWA